MFDELVGNERAKDVLRRMLRHGRVPGALLFAGDEGLGKKLFALELARAFNCTARVGVEACGVCSACTRIGKFQYPPKDPKDAREAYKKVIWSEHKDVGQVLAFAREIFVDAIRDLEYEGNFRPAEGAARVFLVEEADKLNEESSNALLKTLEEPPLTTHIILVTSRPASLLPTIRSRCQNVRFAPLPASQIEEFMVKSRRRVGEEAKLAAQLAGGRPGLAVEFNLDAHLARRDWALGVVEALAGPETDRARLLRAAEELSDAKNKEEFEPYLDVLETLIRDLWLATLRAEGARSVNTDLRERLARLGEGLPPRRVAGWLSRVEELREQLAVNINRRIASDALFLSMAED
ncbi:MAG: DNA polymerase III subunit delta' [Acidobacteria bacterium]|nr:DNA polymerase III subunit delta' [Acidobacteriota bacterium]